MKKLILIATIFIGIAAGANAQKYALGIRGAYGVDLSFQMEMSKANRLELDLGLLGGGLSLAGTYQWVQPINGLPSGFAWYYGVGADISTAKKYFAVGVDGIIGIEYTIPTFPIQFSLDYRPSFGPSFYDNYAEFNLRGLYNAALGVRFKF